MSFVLIVSFFQCLADPLYHSKRLRSQKKKVFLVFVYVYKRKYSLKRTNDFFAEELCPSFGRKMIVSSKSEIAQKLLPRILSSQQMKEVIISYMAQIFAPYAFRV